MHLRKIFYLKSLSLIILLILAGCAENSNDEIAKYRKIDNDYEITLTGKRGNMAHDPISFIFRGSSPSSLVVKVPRISGEVKGNEIPTKEGYYKYLGSINITDMKLIVNLSYDNTDDDKVTPLSWNGNYLLEASK